MARPMKPTFSQEEIDCFIRPMIRSDMRMVTRQGEKKILTSEADHIMALLAVEFLVLRLGHASEPPTYITTGDDPFVSLYPDRELCLLGSGWNRLDRALKPEEQSPDGPTRHITPRLMAFYRAFAPLMNDYRQHVTAGASLMNALHVREFGKMVKLGFQQFKSTLQHPDTQKEMKRLQSRINHNRQQQLKYLDALLAHYGELFTVRLDLGYNADPATGIMRRLTHARAKHDFSQLMLERRHNPLWKDDLVGFMWKLEDGAERRYHYHLMLFYRGETADHHQHDKAVLQHHWINEITQGDGACYLSWETPEETPLEATPEGLIQGRVSPRYLALTRFVDYLNKLDLLIRLDVPKGANVYGRGHVAKTKTINSV